MGGTTRRPVWLDHRVLELGEEMRAGGARARQQRAKAMARLGTYTDARHHWSLLKNKET